MNTPKFLICENPFDEASNKEPRLFILHARHPLLLAEAFHFEGYSGDEPDLMKCKGAFDVGASVDYPGEPVVLGCLWHEALTPKQESANELAYIMSRMGDWYYAYLDWEDKNISWSH